MIGYCGGRVSLSSRVEIAVVGAGPAGSVLACALAKRGRDVLLLERDQFPRDKVCGEFLSPEAVDCLETLGCSERFFAHQPPAMNRTRITVAEGPEIDVQLPGEAYGLSRRRLDALLFDCARDHGARGVEKAVVRKIESKAGGTSSVEVELRREQDRRKYIVEADLVVAAHGRRGSLDRTLERPFFEVRSPYVAFKQHHRVQRDGDVPPLRDYVELHAFDGGYCGVSYVEDDVVNVCTMFERRLLESEKIRAAAPFESLKQGDTTLARRLSTLVPRATKMCAVAQIPLSSKELCRRGVVFAGDAAGMIAPLAGDGQAMAMESALMLAELIDDAWPRDPGRRWARMWRRRYAPRVWLGRGLQRAIVRPRVAGAALHLLRRIPAAGRALVEWTRG